MKMELRMRRGAPASTFASASMLALSASCLSTLGSWTGQVTRLTPACTLDRRAQVGDEDGVVDRWSFGLRTRGQIGNPPT